MNQTEWLEVARRINANWPHQTVPSTALAKWFDDLRDLPTEHVLAAVEVYYREGERFPPNGGQLRAKVAELAINAPDFGAAWLAIVRAIRLFGYSREAEALDWLAGRHELAAALTRQMGWRQLCLSTEPDVIHGQARRVYDALVRRRRSQATLQGLPGAGLPALEAINNGPLQIGAVLGELTEGER